MNFRRKEKQRFMRLNIAVCDDNKFELESEADAIGNAFAEKNIENKIFRFTDPQELFGLNEKYDIVFLDVEMGSLSGIETAEKIREQAEDCIVIFITNYWNYLDNAFAVKAFRYWKKPIDADRLRNGIDSALNELKQKRQIVTLKTRSGEIEIPAKNIVYVCVSNKIVRVVSPKGEISVKDTYSSVRDKLLKTGCFGEIRRGQCVNFMYVKNYTQSELICEYSDKIIETDISRRKFDEFDRAFDLWLGGK